MRQLRPYFRVDIEYVMDRLGRVMTGALLVPSLKRQAGRRRPPTQDANAPDLYLPTVAAATYLLLTTWLSALAGDEIGTAASRVTMRVFSIFLVEVLLVKLVFYLFWGTARLAVIRWLDLVSHLGYVFLPLILTRVGTLLPERDLVIAVWATSTTAHSHFLYRSLRESLPIGKRWFHRRHRLILGVALTQFLITLEALV